MENDFVKVGQLGKSFGIHGFCKVKLYEDFQTISSNSEFLFINHDNYFVPYRVVNLNKAKKMVQFSDIESQHKADRLQGMAIFLPSEKVKGLVQNDDHPLIGYTISSDKKTIGEIVDIREMPHQILATVSSNNKELLIPIHEDLIIELDEIGKLIEMDLPEGLLEL